MIGTSRAPFRPTSSLPTPHLVDPRNDKHIAYLISLLDTEGVMSRLAAAPDNERAWLAVSEDLFNLHTRNGEET
jgi:hypothetical protein